LISGLGSPGKVGVLLSIGNVKSIMFMILKKNDFMG